jgi:hypothetical protein
MLAQWKPFCQAVAVPGLLRELMWLLLRAQPLGFSQQTFRKLREEKAVSGFLGFGLWPAAASIQPATKVALWASFEKWWRQHSCSDI